MRCEREAAPQLTPDASLVLADDLSHRASRSGRRGDCQRDVFSDVFARWGAGELRGEEPEVPPEEEDPEPPRRRTKKFGPGRPPEYWWSKKKLRRMSTKKLRRIALSGYWDERKINAMKRKKLIKLLSTPHWKNEHDKANVRIFASLPPSLRRFGEDES